MRSAPLVLLGNPGSPYSRKMRSALRYRRLPHRWVLRHTEDDRGTPPVPIPLVPVLVWDDPEGRREAMIDSTFQIRRLDARYPGRAIIPTDPATAFLDFLLEDFADEWLTKAMYHYRWSFAESVSNAEVVLPFWGKPGASNEEVSAFARSFAERQIMRRALVGINETTVPIIEASYLELLEALDARLTHRRFVFGDRPGLADFGLFGQLSQLVGVDPSSAKIARKEAPRISAWCEFAEDLSGIDVEGKTWERPNAEDPTFRSLLQLVGRTYAPFLLANADAIDRGASHVDCELSGQRWVQPPFGYQAKCLRWLREAYSALPPEASRQVDEVLAGTGCALLLASPG